MTVRIVCTVSDCHVTVAVTTVRMRAAWMCVMAAVISMSMPPKPASRHPRESNSTERECGEIYVH